MLSGAGSIAESLRGASFRLGRLFFSIFRRRGGFEQKEKARRNARYFIHCSQERGFVRLRRLREAADFSHELERGSFNLFGSDGRIEVEESFDIPAHLA